MAFKPENTGKIDRTAAIKQSSELLAKEFPNLFTAGDEGATFHPPKDFFTSWSEDGKTRELAAYMESKLPGINAIIRMMLEHPEDQLEQSFIDDFLHPTNQ